MGASASAMPHISACIGSIELALASMAKWPTSCTRAIQALSWSRLRMVWYLLRSIFVLRAASARAAASEIGGAFEACGFGPASVPLLRCAPSPACGGGSGRRVIPGLSKRYRPRATAPSGLPASGGGAKTLAPLLLPAIRFDIGRIDLRIFGDAAGQRGKFHRLQERDQLARVGLMHRELIERHVERRPCRRAAPAAAKSAPSRRSRSAPRAASAA